MKTNEKAAAAETGQTAVETNQANPITDMDCCQYPVDPVIPELIEAIRPGDSIKISERTFFNWFNFGSYDIDGSGRYSAEVGGVEFFCLVEKEDGHVSM